MQPIWRFALDRRGGGQAAGLPVRAFQPRVDWRVQQIELDPPPFVEGQPITLGIDGGGLVAIATSLMTSDDLLRSRRDQRALKTERVLVRDH